MAQRIRTRAWWVGASILAGAGPASGQCIPAWAAANAMLDGHVSALGALQDAQGPALYVGGWFSQAGGVAASRVARFDGHTWIPLGSGIPGNFNTHGFQGCCATVRAFAGGGTGRATRVHIAGNFIFAGGVQVESIADYAGGQWHALAGGVANVGCFDCAFVVHSITRFGPGSGALYAGGTFDLAGGVAAARVARWDGAQWTAVGGGIGTAPGDPFPSWVQALTPYNGQLYAAGFFSLAGTIQTNSIAALSGSDWTDVGGGLGIAPSGRRPSIAAMAVYDDGTGPALYAAGIMDLAGGVEVRNIARWNGATWSALGSGIGSGVNDRVHTMAVFDDGSGPALYVGGEFSDAGGASALNIARWNGHAWSAVESGVDGPVLALSPFDDGNGASLYVGGTFQGAGGVTSPHLVKWVGCPVCYANCDHSSLPPILNIADFACFLNQFAAGSGLANCDGSSTPPILNISDFTCFLNRFAAGCD